MHWYSEAPGMRAATWAFGRAQLWDAMAAGPAERGAALEPEAAVRWWHEHGDCPPCDETLDRLRRGLVLLLLVPESHAAGVGPRVVPATREETAVPLRLLAAPQTASEALTWIEIVLVDSAEQPVPHEPYEVELPDGRVITGQLDADGFARVDGVRAGQCVVRFPDCAREDVEAA